MGHIRVAVAVTAHPGSKTYRCNIQRQFLGTLLLYQAIQFPDEFRDCIPQGLFNGGKTPFGFINRRRAMLTDFIGLPGRTDQLFQIGQNRLTFTWGKFLLVEFGQGIIDTVIFLNQGAAADFRWVRSQDQFNFQFTDLLIQRLSGNFLLFKFFK